jgi:4-aminobutyrate aminotransferase / (S)-3-amino-2-methylpropionate transaminase / 5-aminovalerate transaminase
MSLSGDELPHIIVPAPGPQSRQLASRLARVESPNITLLEPPPPFWTEARGAAVRDADGNTYIDLTAGFGVAHAGHANPAVTAAIREQAVRLAHGLGDVYPTEIRVRLLERLAAIAPGDIGVAILGSAGAEAVEAALKTAVLRTGRTGIVAFHGGYHGLTYGALGVTHRADFRTAFRAQLFPGVRFAPYPAGDDARAAVAAVRDLIAAAESSAHPVGAVIVEPILGRGGLVVPPPAFLPSLRELCDGEHTLLICDEIYTGCGRTGRWFACEHDGVVPDVLAIGKAVTGSLPLSAALGTPKAMRGWPRSAGEAIHTSTFLGNPIACAAALAQLEQIESLALLARAAALGDRIRDRAQYWHRRLPTVGEPRGRGLIQGVPVRGAGSAVRVAERCLIDGIMILAEGPDADVLAITPPAVITDDQLEHALHVIETALAAVAG